MSEDNNSNKSTYSAFPRVEPSTEAPSRPPASDATRARLEDSAAYSAVEEPQQQPTAESSPPRLRRSSSTKSIPAWSATRGFSAEENAMYSNIISEKGSVGPPPPTDEELERRRRERENKAESGVFGNTSSGGRS
ncbi:hypothetical protein IAR50_007120 [Cryptococcus sp. DSM 104548]